MGHGMDERTGPSPKSFSGFWKDILTEVDETGGIEMAEGRLVSFARGEKGKRRNRKLGGGRHTTNEANCQSRPELRGSVR